MSDNDKKVDKKVDKLMQDYNFIDEKYQRTIVKGLLNIEKMKCGIQSQTLIKFKGC